MSPALRLVDPTEPDDVTRRAYLFPVPAKPLRSLLDSKARAGEEFSEEEATLDVMLAVDRDDLRPLRYLAARWGWSKNRVHRTLDALRAQAAEWRAFYADAGPSPGQPLGQAGTGVGQAGTETGPVAPTKAESGTGVGQAGTDLGQYRTDPDTRPRQNPSPPNPPGGGKDAGKPKKARAKKPPEPVALPEWIDADTWADWEAHRREIGKALKPTTVKHQLRQLQTLRSDGHDPNAAIRQSLAAGWVGLFAPKPGDGSRPLGTPRGQAGSPDGQRPGGRPGGALAVRGAPPANGHRLSAAERRGQFGPQRASEILEATRALRNGRGPDDRAGDGG